MCRGLALTQPLDMEMLDGLFNGAVTKLRQSGNKWVLRGGDREDDAGGGAGQEDGAGGGKSGAETTHA